uniref:Translocase of inner mitochondrial membrane 10B n=1 Tax=Mus musculus TaxID=10090 RepID=D6RJ48_MOUSE
MEQQQQQLRNVSESAVALWVRRAVCFQGCETSCWSTIG